MAVLERAGREHAIVMQRILVVDDDPSVTSVLKRGLSYEGYLDC
jgi:CheY-like chemotaxis protein